MHTVQYRTLVANVSEMSFSSVALYNMQLFCILRDLFFDVTHGLFDDLHTLFHKAVIALLCF